MERINPEGRGHLASLQRALCTAPTTFEVIERPGSFVTKQINGGTYWYFQTTALGRQTQTYIGPHEPEIEGLVGLGMMELAELRAHASTTARWVALALAGGCASHATAEREVLKLLETVGVFRLGGVLLGGAAFVCLGNMLGVRWDAEARVGGASGSLEIALRPSSADHPATPTINLPEACGLSARQRGPTLTLKVRNTVQRLELCVPATTKSPQPVALPSLGARARPVRILDYVLDDPCPAPIVGGDGVLVSVPNPARFALHKLVVAGERTAKPPSKLRVDLEQARQLLEVLLEDRAEELQGAWAALRAHGDVWSRRARRSTARLEPGLTARLRAALPGLAR